MMIECSTRLPTIFDFHKAHELYGWITALGAADDSVDSCQLQAKQLQIVIGRLQEAVAG
jgi:hypothetical protein